MSSKKNDRPTRPDVPEVMPHGDLEPETVPKRGMIKQGDPTQGEVGKTSIYAQNVARIAKEGGSVKDTNSPKGGKLVAGWNRGLKGSELGFSIGGRPTSLTPELEEELFSYLREGKPVTLCCRMVGLDASTLSRWRKAEREAKDPELTRFFIDFAYNRAIGEMAMVNTALRGDGREYSHGPSRSAQWLLERAFSNTYAPRTNLKIEEVSTLSVDAVTKVCSSKDCGCYEQLLAAFQELAEAQVTGDDE